MTDFLLVFPKVPQNIFPQRAIYLYFCSQIFPSLEDTEKGFFSDVWKVSSMWLRFAKLILKICSRVWDSCVDSQ